MNKLWFHIDMDAFFASVEQLDHPAYRGKPVIVGALPGQRGVVSTCSYEARKFGVHSALPISEAFRRCPDGIYVQPRMDRYQELSRSLMGLFGTYTPRLIQVSVDEAFLDMSGTRRLLGHPEDIARKIKSEISASVGLTLSIGIAPNKFLAKIASAYAKPDGLTIIPESGEEPFILALPLDKLWGLGKKTRASLHLLQIETVADLRSKSLEFLRGHCGSASAEFLFQAARGIDPGIYEGETKQHSISSETTFDQDVAERFILERALFDICNNVMFRLKSELAASQVVALKIRYSDFSTFTIQRKIGHELASIEESHALACELLDQRWNGTSPVRLIGFGFDQVHPAAKIQASLFEDTEARRGRVEQAVLGLRERYRQELVQKASLVQPRREED